MAHIALYRTYRPQNFDSVVGQKHIVQTMKNQINHDLLTHAYLFTGPRGTGKTSIARIVAKAINCTTPEAGNPCSTCESCLGIANGNHPDVFELDGASNNGVDEIRDIRERVKYSPSFSAYKIYIIDEVHMLTTGAFNALLKTLEEPPPHVKFMLATTEIHKVPDTILSRVQRFDLKQIPSGEMTYHLQQILQDVAVEFEEGVPELVTHLASGGLRDALSILDQAIAYKTDIMMLADIHELNGSVDITELTQMINCIISSDYAGISESTRKLLASGKLPARIIDGLLTLLRDNLKIQKIGGHDAIGLSLKLDSERTLKFIKKLNQLNHELKIATDAELILEVGLIELAFIEIEISEINMSASEAPATTPLEQSQIIKDLISEIRQLQKEVADLKLIRSVAKPAAIIQQPTSEFPVFVQGELMNKASLAPTEFLQATEMTELDQLGGGVETEELLIEVILAAATKNDKEILQQRIDAVNAFAKLDIKEVVMLLKDAEIAAATAGSCLLVYDYETTAQKLLIDENHKKARDFLTDMMGRPYEFLVLPKEFWLVQRELYVAQNRKGPLNQYPQSVKMEQKKEQQQSSDAPFYQEVLDMFGEMVEVVE